MLDKIINFYWHLCDHEYWRAVSEARWLKIEELAVQAWPLVVMIIIFVLAIILYLEFADEFIEPIFEEEEDEL